MNTQRLKAILGRAKTKRILVIGDLMLDEFVLGKVGRISPEAPVPVSRIVASVRRRLAKTDAIIFEDYGKGFLSPELVRRICDQARRAGKIVTADPNPDHPVKWRWVTAVKPNRNEAFLAAGIPA